MYAQLRRRAGQGAQCTPGCCGRFVLYSPQRYREKLCTDSKRYEEALALTARETGKVGHHGWALATVRARSNPKQNSYTAPRGRSCEWAVVVPSRLLPTSEALT